jgi:hypothetical protein
MELVDITPKDSVVPVYLEVLTDKEQAERDAGLAQAQADQEALKLEKEAKEAAKISGMNKLIALGLTEEEAGALING